MPLTDKFLSGTCTLHIGDKSLRGCACYLNLEKQVFEVQVRNENSVTELKHEADFRLTNVKLITPLGELSANSIPIAFASNINHRGWKSSSTEILTILAIDASFELLNLVVNSEIEFDIKCPGKEILFFPGIATYGKFQVSEDLFINGTKDNISLIGKLPDNCTRAKFALSVAIGSPLRKFSHLSNNKIRMIINNFGFDRASRPIFYCGYPYREMEIVRNNLIETFNKTYKYMRNLNKEKESGMRNALSSFLQARTLSGSYQVQILAAYHFLEWFDGSKTMSANQLQNILQISRLEAEGINNIRNGLIHNNTDLLEIIQRGSEKIASSNSELSQKVLNFNRHDFGYMNYLFTLLGRALFREIGIHAQTDYYLPVTEDH